MRIPRPDLTNPHLQRGLILSAALMVVVFFFFFTNFLPFFYPPREVAIEQMKARVERLTAEVEQAKRTAANLPRLEKEMEVLHTKWEEATKLLPDEKEVAVLLRKVTVAGQQSGVEFLVFEPSDPMPGAFYTEHPVTVQVRGGYHNVGNFLAGLAGMTRIVNVTDLDLKALDQERVAREERGDVSTTVEAAMTIAAYSLGADQVRAITDGEAGAGATATPQAQSDRRSAFNEE